MDSNKVPGALLGVWLLMFVPAAHGQDLPAPARTDSTAVQAFSATQDTTVMGLAAPQDTAAVVLEAVRDTTGLTTGAEQLQETAPSVQGMPQDTTAVAEDPVIRLEIDGLVVDETQTRLGRDFYDIFFARWQAPEDAFNFTITIDEQPLPNLGTRIIVKVNDDIAFQGQLQPRYDYIEAVVEQAIPYVRTMVQRRASRQFIY